jgi:hypothetical protein
MKYPHAGTVGLGFRHALLILRCLRRFEQILTSFLRTWRKPWGLHASQTCLAATFFVFMEESSV